MPPLADAAIRYAVLSEQMCAADALEHAALHYGVFADDLRAYMEQRGYILTPGSACEIEDDPAYHF